MINKIGARGRDVAGLVRYLFGPGRFDEHRDQRVIAADARLEVADGTRLNPDAPADRERVNELARVLDNHRRLMCIEPVGGWVWHCAIALPKKETPGGELKPETLSDEQWAIVARTAVERLGFGEDGPQAPCRWIAVHHGPSAGGNDHIHLLVNLVRTDGRLADPGRDRRTMSRVCAEAEREFGLFVVEGRAGRGLPGLSRAEIERTKRGAGTGPPSRTAGQRPGRIEPDRITLARNVRAAAAAAGSEAEFVRRLKAMAVRVHPRYAADGTGEVVGYAVALPALPAYTNAKGKTIQPKPVWFGGGKLAADLTLPKLRAGWSGGEADEARAEWASEAVPVTAPGRSEAPVADADAWKHAAALIDDIRKQLHDLPADDPRWTIACRGTAAVTSALALAETRPGALAGLADALARSAQDPRRVDGPPSLPERWMRRDFSAAVRLIRQAAQSPDLSADAMVVVVGTVLLAKAITQLHTERQQPHQARVLTQRTTVLAGQVAGLAPWEVRPHGQVPTSRLRDLVTRIEADVDRLVRTELRTEELTEAARNGRGPDAAALQARRKELEKAAAAEQALPAARRAAKLADERVADLDAEVRRLKALSEKRGAGLWLKGISKNEVLEDLALARQERRQARIVRDHAHADVGTLVATASGLYGAAPTPTPWRQGAATDALRRLSSDWTASLAKAVADDVATAAHRALLQNPRTRAEIAALSFGRPGEPRPATTLAEARRRLQAVRAELALRETLPGDVAKAEKTQRAAAQPAAALSSPAPTRSSSRTPPTPDRGRGGRGR
ncbi:hypothetical protein Ppa06_64420 [Planomonospora parontospora subsp. parontospora]|uniref:MobA/VirD2-like nuclease domain-containing protein n=2 Tax=Planomonospora parontospora TaxID=58119 RepID=A0AA37F7M1_9ACTN|nr:hypothetical protein [Planomonospora parontospora]GGK94143.1 hypothetical protein GCM10010126_61880 [Planomonospora parontospora]GII12644.1 hypothetical protein Ppa06_64420 [Planomonospora parontospora subsp. parontospora]